jgi:hypothetical protein
MTAGEAQRVESFALKFLGGQFNARIDCDQLRPLGYDEGELLRLISLYATLPAAERNYQILIQGGGINITRLPHATARG